MSRSEDVTRRDFLHMAGAAAFALGLNTEAGALPGPLNHVPELLSSPSAKRTFDLAQLKWRVAAFIPYLWSFDKLSDIEHAGDAEVGPVDAPVPGSVQQALLNAGILQDWNVGLNSRNAEWVENRDWVYQAELPDEWLQQGQQLRLRCAGLDYEGAILLNGKQVLPFCGSFTPYAVDLKPHLEPKGNLLQIWLQPPPRWLGQFGYTSRMTQWKPRFNYTWDWIIRLVQIGIWDSVTLDVVQDAEIRALTLHADFSPDANVGSLHLAVDATGGASVQFSLRSGDRVVREQLLPVTGGMIRAVWTALPVDAWWPNGMGEQSLYTVDVKLLDGGNRVIDTQTRRVGFRHIEWQRTRGAAPDAHPYLCVVNGKPVFLFGVNWTPIRPNFADLKESDYRKRIANYRDIGVNVFRVWGGGFPEHAWLYDLCDENGILVWQEFPLSSSGMDNYPPDSEEAIAQMTAVARFYIDRLHSQACLATWCGGNELEDNLAGHVSKQTTLTIAKHPLVVRLAETVAQHDAGRGFLPTSPFGPVGGFTQQTCGQGKHWDVHGPWNLDGPVDGAWRELWQHDDAMFHSEMGAPSTSSAAMIRRYKGELPEVPGTHANPLWNRQPWWIEWPKFAIEKGRQPASLDEFVAWSQQRQSDALALAIAKIKSRFPACGGAILWMGHDCMPCTTNASILDFDGNPKPAALVLKRILRES